MNLTTTCHFLNKTKSLQTRIMTFMMAAATCAATILICGCGTSGPDGTDASHDAVDTDARDTQEVTDLTDAHDTFQRQEVTDAYDMTDATDPTDTTSDTPDTSRADWWVDLEGSGLPLNSIVGIASQMSTNAAPNDQRDFEYQQYAPFPGFRMRNGHRFDDVERVQGVWDWDRVSGSVTGAAAVGSKVLMGLDYSVDWAQDGPDLIGTVHIDDFAEYAGAMAGHFCETVKEYEIWNEPNVQIF